MTRRLGVLDGLRGLAILLVLINHTWSLEGTSRIDRLFAFLATGGWTSIVLFFALSGFLITGILVDSREGAHYFRNFYARRFLRIFPLYYALLFVVFVVVPMLPATLRPQGDVASGDRIWFWLYLSNFVMAAQNHFGQGGTAVTWSLAVEEQFYLVWAPIVYLLVPRRLIKLCVVLIAAALVWRVSLVLSNVAPLSTFVLLPTHMDSIATGATIALLLRTQRGADWLRATAPRVAIISLISVLAIGATSVAELDFADPLMQMFGYSLLALFYGSVLSMAVTSPPSRWKRFLEGGPLRMLGRYSYGMYLLHVPVSVLVERAGITPKVIAPVMGSMLPGQLAFTITVTAASIVVGAASWHLFESRVLSLKRHFAYPFERTQSTRLGLEQALFAQPSATPAEGRSL